MTKQRRYLIISSYWAGYSGIALILTETEFPNENIAKCDEDMAQKGAEIFHITHLSHEDCEGIAFIPYRKSDGTINMYLNKISDQIEKSFHDIYCIFSSYDPAGPFSIENTPYRGYKDIHQEFYQKLKDYLPKDFDYHAHIGQIWYAAYA